jgi:hypothetical protein
LHQLLAKQYPCEGGAEGEDDQHVAIECGLALGGRTAVPAKNDERGADSGSDESEPGDGVEALAGKEHGGYSQQHGHGTHHERSVADGGMGESVELDEELDGDAEGGGDEQDADLACGEANAVEQGYREQAEAGEEESVEHHVLHAHFIEGQTAEVEASSPEASCNCACAIAEEGGARAEGSVRGHLSFYCRMRGSFMRPVGCAAPRVGTELDS